MTCEPVNIDCMEPPNFAAIAKKLHSTALEAEERIYCLEQALRAGVNRPTWIGVTTVDIVGTTATSPTDPYNGTGISPPIIIGGLTTIFQNSQFAMQPFGIVPEGVWHIGAFADAFASGAVDDNSFRALTAETASAGNVMWRTTSESNSGAGNLLTVSAVWTFDGQTPLAFKWCHGNTSSTMTVRSGATFWLTKISDLSPLRVL